MQTLTALYQNSPKNIKFINRKFEITAPKTLIKGGIGSGKTSLIAGFLSAFESKEFLYINLGDLRIDADEILSNLPDFLRQNPQIKILAIDDFEQRFQEKLEPILELNLSNFIVASRFKDANLSGFSELNLDFLDYEEFIAFFSKRQKPSVGLWRSRKRRGKSTNRAKILTLCHTASRTKRVRESSGAKCERL